MRIIEPHVLRAAVRAEIHHIRKLGSNKDLILASSNLGAYEALLIILGVEEDGIPVYEAISTVQSGFSTQACLINRIGLMRKAGLIMDKPGKKKSQVCLVPSEKLLQELGSILAARHGNAL